MNENCSGVPKRTRATRSAFILVITRTSPPASGTEAISAGRVRVSCVKTARSPAAMAALAVPLDASVRGVPVEASRYKPKPKVLEFLDNL